MADGVGRSELISYLDSLLDSPSFNDYGPNGRDVRYLTTVGEEKRSNVHVAQDISCERFVRQRKSRDEALSPPALLVPALTANVQGGMEVAAARCPVSALRGA